MCIDPNTEARKAAKPLTEADALYWESSARSSRIEAARARNLESKATHLREADDAERHATAIRSTIAKAEVRP